MSKSVITTLILLCHLFVAAQKKKSIKIGKATTSELKMITYEKDTLANAVVLYEQANVYLDERRDYKFRTDYYYRIKLFNKDAFDLANITIPFYNKKEIRDIEAVTYNLNGNEIEKTKLKKEAIFTVEKTEFWNETRFTLPNLKEGCVIEYVYSVISPYSRLDDWYFQSDIPKIKSQYYASILGNYKYNIRLVGDKALDHKEVKPIEDCITISGLGTGGCNNYAFGMDTIPAFKEEAYMLSEENYLSRIIFDKISYTDVRGGVTKYTKTWDDADKTLKRLFLDNQTTKQSFFKKQLPDSILNTNDALKKGKSVYKYIQDKLFWNKKYWTHGKLKIKNTFQEGTGSVDAINLILHNSLNAAGIENYLVALSTRNNGLPTKIYPMTKDFNYIIVKAVIDGKSYFLDASDKKLAFGQVPFKCLNGEVRVLDFDNGGYWETIDIAVPSMISVFSNLEFNENLELEGELNLAQKGYPAITERKRLDTKSNDEYLDDFESKHPNILVDDYSVENQNALDKSLVQKFQITLDHDFENPNTLRFNPFIYRKISNNPFKLNKRNYDIDYGYPRTILFSINIKIPEGYRATKLPENKRIALPYSGGNFMLSIGEQNGTITINSRLYIMKKNFAAEEYEGLKEFYNQIIKAQNSYIELEKN